jgi:uncharacterized NAD-dependent epimerase/dehydratase family protein
MRVAILAHETFPERAKTALGVLRYADHEVVAVLDRANAGGRVNDLVADVPDAPVVASMSDAPEADALLVGVAPIGGGFEESWRPDVRTALRRGCDVVAGLHDFLADDEEFASLAAEHGADIRDVRRPPEHPGVAEGAADSVDATVVATVGTDCSVGKMTTTMEMAAAAGQRGWDAAVVPTGQTGIMVEGRGVPVDRVVSDFAAGAVEGMVLDQRDHDYVFVEGQGSLVHPAYSPVTLAVLHGAMPDALVLCHRAGRETVHGYDQSIPPVDEVAGLYESLAAPVAETEVVAGALNTQSVAADGAAREAVAAFGDAIDAPATDPLRFGVDAVLDAL